MKQEIISTIGAILKADDTTTAQHREEILRMCRGLITETPNIGTRREAANILNVHPVTVARYERAGLIAPIRYNSRKVRYDLNAVRRLAQIGI